ncbi:putative Histidine kinase [Desulforamulus hydrothermalis Lam5 = DSM 18033]|uniref:histidine kinase n=1 Tax=Desulforamulus hydrothermalis Lam5 = DSM 18033 TaxID=1121428 RepID=K8DZK3_9FIRM|nr:PAS domain-containing sensor histidine kinase [Desulforamulus hydrothermalis]CCO08529.1 putative Histidine kinase [Desulforamulus hydrothermalis Lam5 = DSM 18033]SHH02810.1 PAS domain S-box-containing protein [Desulforamulus hydrothermalis Lam5 = DSM 18033]
MAELRQCVQPAQTESNNRRKPVLTEEQLLYLLDKSPVIFFTCQAGGDWRPRFISSNIRDVFGYEAADFMQPHFFLQRIHPADLNQVAAAQNKLLQEGAAEGVFRFRCADGTYKWTYKQAKLLFDRDNKPSEVIGYWVDIDERKRFEISLKLTNQKITNILERITDCFFALDNDWRFTYINKEAEKYFNIDKTYLLGKCIWDIFPKTIETDFGSYCLRAKTSQLPVCFEYRSVYYDKWCEMNIYPAPDGLSVYFRDITGRKENDQKLARLDRLNLVGQMAAGLAHEIRNPLTTVRGFLQILGEKADCRQYKKYYALMIEELDRANGIISEFLSLARNKKANLRLHNLNDILRAVSELIRADALNSNKNVIIQTAPLPDLLLDAKDIRQLLLNLVRNGLEAMAPGGTLTVKTYLDKQEVVLAVQDQGSGIDPSVIEKLGTPFLTTKETGTGLGLAVCYGIARRHGAAIDFTTGSEGTTFYVKFRTHEL